jgi:Trk K+ transport system NAD-binding subunit
VLEVQIAPASRAAGRCLAELGLGKGVLVMAVERAGELMVRDGKTRLEVGDRVLLVTSGDVVAHVLAAL